MHCFLCFTYTGPIGISPRNSDDPPLEPGMFVTDEPGYYEDGAFGIRIENVLLVVEKQLKVISCYCVAYYLYVKCDNCHTCVNECCCKKH